MTDTPTARVATALLREVPLANMSEYVSKMTAADACGTGCGAGCGNNCRHTLDHAGAVLTEDDLKAGQADKAALLSEVSKQAAVHVQSLAS
jgi:hypothetical protein